MLGEVYLLMCTREACWVLYIFLCAPGRHAGWCISGYVSQGGMLGVVYRVCQPGRHAGCTIPTRACREVYIPPGHAGRCISHPGYMRGIDNPGTCWVLITRVCAGRCTSGMCRVVYLRVYSGDTTLGYIAGIPP